MIADDITFKRGDTYYSRKFQAVEEDGATPIDLTAWTMAGEARVAFDDPVEAFFLNVVKDDAVNGIFYYVILASETEALTPAAADETYVFDVQMEDLTGTPVRHTLVGGTATVQPDVTR